MKVKIPDSRILATIDEIRNPVVPLGERAQLTAHGPSQWTRATMYYTVYVRSYPWKAVEVMYYYIIITNFAIAVAVSAVTWSAILRYLLKITIYSRILPRNAAALHCRVFP